MPSKRNKDKQPSQRSTTLNYSLSDKKYIDLGWTKLPKNNNSTHYSNDYILFETKPWNFFKKGFISKPHMTCYSDGQIATTLNENGTGFIYYPNGSPAIEFQNSNVYGQRILLYKEYKDQKKLQLDASEKNYSFDEKSIKYSKTELLINSLIGCLDSRGVCSIYDDKGKPIITYDQFGGLIYGNDINKYYQWVWCVNYDGSSAIRDINCHLKLCNDHDTLRIHENHSNTKDCKISLSKSESKINTITLKKSSSCTHVSTDLLKDFIIGKHYMCNHLGKLPKDVHKCVINESISLWISNQNKIDLCFSSSGFIIRIDVGVVIKTDNFPKKRYVNPCKYRVFPDFTSDSFKNKLCEAKLKPN